jgi:hypothetical protein
MQKKFPVLTVYPVKTQGAKLKMELTRKQFILGVISSVFLGAKAVGEAEGSQSMTTKILTLKDVVGLEVYKKAGLQKLTFDEQMVLADWINDYMNFISKSIEEDCRKGLIK